MTEAIVSLLLDNAPFACAVYTLEPPAKPLLLFANGVWQELFHESGEIPWALLLSPKNHPHDWLHPRTKRWLRLHTTHLPSAQVLVYLYDVTADIERSYKQMMILNSLDDILLEMDQHFVFTHVFTADERHLFLPREQILGRPLPEVMGPKYATLILPYLQQAVVTGIKQIFEYPEFGGNRWFRATVQYVAERHSYTVLISDITLWKQQEQETRRLNDILEKTSRAARIGSWEVDMQTQQLYWSPITREIHEVDQDYIPNLQSAIYFFAEGESRSQIQAAVEQAMTQGTPYSLDLDIVTAQGNLRHTRAIGQSEMLNGSCIRIYGTFQDIHAEKELQKKLELSESRFRGAFEHSAIGMALLSPEGHWLKVNDRICQLLGYNETQLMGLTFQDITHPADLDADLLYVQQLLAGDIDTYQMEKRYIHAQGYLVWGLLSVSLVRDECGQPVHFVSQIQDITRMKQAELELRQAHQELQAIFNSGTHVSVISTDIDGIITFFSRGAETLLGYSAADMVGIHTPLLLHLEPEILLRQQELQAELGSEVQRFEILVHDARTQPFDRRDWTYVRKDGSQFPAQLIVTAIRDVEGKTTGFLGIATDISQQKATEDALREAKSTAEAANHAKSQFLANMSHEIRTPLNGVIGFSELLMTTPLDEVQQQYLKSIQVSADTLMNLINDVLDFSKIEAGKLELESEQVDLIQLLEETIEVIKYAAAKKGLELLINVPPQIPRYVVTDAVRLRQIITNLLSNAIKFTEKGEIELAVHLEDYDATQGQGYFCFSVRDTGIGISEAQQEKLFKAFVQADLSTTRKYGGSGLGLVISSNLVEKMGGRLCLESTLGNGSLFYFALRLPCESGPESALTPLALQRVLLVDDNPQNLRILQGMLSHWGVPTIITASHGIEALKHLQKQGRFDLMIVDYQMPFMDGLEVMRQVRERLHLSPLEQPAMLLHSSAEDAQIYEACQRWGVTLRMVKPITLRELERALQRFRSSGNAAVISTTTNDPAPAPIGLPLHVLVADDNAINILLAKAMLAQIDPYMQVIEARNGDEAVAHYKTYRPDIVLMDIQMPGKDGYTAAEEIRAWERSEAYGRTPILALTAGTLKGEREKCLAAGMDDYLAKPIHLEGLRTLMLTHNPRLAP